MTSRFPAEALRPHSASVKELKSFQVFLANWEAHMNGAQGFLSKTTATGLIVTIASVLPHTYNVSRLASGILWPRKLAKTLPRIFLESRGSHLVATLTPWPGSLSSRLTAWALTPSPVSTGNCKPGILSTLLPADSGRQDQPSGRQQLIDKLIENGNMSTAEELVTDGETNHSCVVAKSNNRPIFYVAGYVACKCILKTGCEDYT